MHSGRLALTTRVLFAKQPFSHDKACMYLFHFPSEAEVDLAIRVLMQAGSYNDCLRRRYEAGLNVRGLGNTDLVIKTLLVPWTPNLRATRCNALCLFE